MDKSVLLKLVVFRFFSILIYAFVLVFEYLNNDRNGGMVFMYLAFSGFSGYAILALKNDNNYLNASPRINVRLDLMTDKKYILFNFWLEWLLISIGFICLLIYKL